MNPIKAAGNTLHYLKRLLIREKDYLLCRPVVTYQFLTYRCTSKCQSCNMWTRENDAHELTLEEWKTVIDNMHTKKDLRAEIFGGDALLRTDILIPLIKYMFAQGVPYIDMPTNCNLLNEELAQELVDSGLNRIYISLDSGEAHQDAIRGHTKSYTNVTNAVRFLKQARGEQKRPELCTNTTVSNLNYDSFESVIDASLQMGTDSVDLGYVGEFNKETLANSVVDGIKPNPYFASSSETLRVNEQQARELKARIKSVRQRTRKLPLYFSAKNIDILRIADLVSGKFPFKKCYAARINPIIDPYGNVTPCAHYPEYILGNLVQQPMTQIWNNRKHKLFLKKVESHQLPICFECIYNMERNPTFFQALKQLYLIYAGKGLDEPT